MHNKSIIKVLTNKDYFIYKQLGILYDTVFNTKINLDLYNQWYKSTPYNSIVEYACIIDNELVAYNYFFPQYYNSFKIFLSGGSMVNPLFKGEFVSFFQKVQEDISKTTDCSLLYGFSNSNAFPIVSNKFGFDWKENKNYKLLNLIKQKNSELFPKIEFNICKISSIEIAPSQISSLARSYDWVKWRLRKPNTSYSVIEWNKKYIIYKEYKNNVDLISILNCCNLNEYIMLLHSFFCYVVDRNYKMLSLIVTNNKLFHEISNHFEFEFDKYERHLCFKSLVKDFDMESEDLLLEMIDSDVF